MTTTAERSGPGGDLTDLLADLGVLALGSRLRRVSDRIMSSGARIYRDHHLEFEPRWFPVFRCLAERGEAAVGEVARAIGFTHAAVSQTARQMERQGVLTIRKDPDDERRRVLALTAAGRAMLPDLRELWADIEAAAREIVDRAGVDILAALDGIEHAMDEEDLAARTRRRWRARDQDRVEIVDFHPGLADDFRRLNLEWLQRWFRVEPLDQELLDHPEREVLDKGGHLLFAKVDGEVVGCVGLLPEGEGELELIKMAVTERYRGRQIGRRLMRAAIDRAREVGARALVLETNSGLLPAVSLYRSAGFRVTHAGPSHTYERGDLFMRLDL